MARAELQGALAPVLTRWIRATCVWKRGALIGDYRFVVFSIDVAPGILVFVQFWSEPGEPVICEVSSGTWNPPVDAWLAGERSERIAAFGFEIGGNADNFRREVTICTPTQAAQMAATIADIMYAGFDYRGLQPVKARLGYESRANLSPVYNSFTPEDLAKVFRNCRFFVEVVSDELESPVLHARRRGITTTITGAGQIPDQRLYRAAMLSARVQAPAHPQPAQGSVEPDATATEFETTLVFDGGVTMEWLVRRIEAWDDATWSCCKEARHRSRPPRVPAPQSDRVH